MLLLAMLLLAMLLLAMLLLAMIPSLVKIILMIPLVKIVL